jgi:hypothetical protein
MGAAVAVFLLAYLGTLIWASVVGVQKGKTTMVILGWLLFTPCVYIAACRYAKPNSSWARKNYQYDPVKLQMSKMRFPKETYLLNLVAAQESPESASTVY